MQRQTEQHHDGTQGIESVEPIPTRFSPNRRAHSTEVYIGVPSFGACKGMHFVHIPLSFTHISSWR